MLYDPQRYRLAMLKWTIDMFRQAKEARHQVERMQRSGCMTGNSTSGERTVCLKSEKTRIADQVMWVENEAEGFKIRIWKLRE